MKNVSIAEADVTLKVILVFVFSKNVNHLKMRATVVDMCAVHLESTKILNDILFTVYFTSIYIYIT